MSTLGSIMTRLVEPFPFSTAAHALPEATAPL